jgi:hypothetical protein
MKQRMRLLATAALAVVAFAALQAAALADGGSRGTIYSSIPKKLPGNVVSLGFEATQTKEFGDHVRFTSGSKRKAREVTVVLSSWGCESGAWHTGDCRTRKKATFKHPLTLNLYAVSGGALGPLLTTVTKRFRIPYRPPRARSATVGAGTARVRRPATTASRSKSPSSSGSAASRCPTR